MDRDLASKKILFRTYFIALLVYNKKYKMVASFINKIGKEDINEIKKILDDSIISESYHSPPIPDDMLVEFIDDEHIYETTRLNNIIFNSIYIMISVLAIASVTYLFPMKDIENLPPPVNYMLPLLMGCALIAIYTQLPSLLRKFAPHVFLNSEINYLTENIVPTKPGQISIYRDLLRNLNQILNDEKDARAIQTWMTDNSFETRSKELKLTEKHVERARNLLSKTAKLIDEQSGNKNWRTIEKDFRFFSTLKGYVLIRRSAQQDKSKYKPELFFNILYAFKNVESASKTSRVDVRDYKAYYEVIIERMIDECEQRNLYAEIFQMAYESYNSKNIYIFSTFQRIATKKGITIDVIFDRMKEKHLNSSIKVLGYLLSKVESFLIEVKENQPEKFEELEMRVNILKASIPERITNKAIELWQKRQGNE